jgi:hypothetical protein
MIRRAWRFSKTIFLNVVSIALAVLTELMGYVLNLEWATIINNPKLLFWWMMGMNVLNIILRMRTSALPGQKDKVE